MEDAPALFLQMVQRDPLFSAEGMDLEGGEQALRAIEEAAQVYEKISGRNSFLTRLWYMRHPLAHYALPVPFLRSFIQSEGERRRFLIEPTAAAAQRLIDAWSHTLREYRRCVENFLYLQRTIRELALRAGSKSDIYDVFGHLTSPHDVEGQLGELKKNVHALEGDLRDRAQLLRGGSEYRMRVSHDDSDLRFVSAEIPLQYKKVHEAELRHALPFRHGTILEQYGPLSYTLSHFDGKPTPHIFMVYILRNNETGLLNLRVSALDEYRFRKTGMVTDVWHIRSQAQILGTDIPYWYQPATNLYSMRDQQYIPDIATIVDIKRRPHLNTTLMRAQRSSTLDLLLGACLEDHAILLAHVKDNCRRDNYTLDLAWLWARMRAHPSLYFLPFNGSVWRLPERLSFLGTSIAKSEEQQYLKADVVLPNLSDSEFDLVMRAGAIREEARKAQETVSP